MAFTRPKASAAARGYGKEHQAERARRIPLHPTCSCLGYCREHTGTCGRPLTPRNARLPHLPDRSGYYPGLWCHHCNQQEAVRRGADAANAKRKRERLIRATPYRW